MESTKSKIFNKTDLLIIILLTLVNFLIFLPYFTGDFGFTLFSDNAIYATLAQRFSDGNFDKAFHIWWQPLYPFLASLIIIFTENPQRSLFLVSVISGAILFIPVYLLTKLITKNYFYAIVSASLAIYSDKLVNSFFVLLTENLYSLLFMNSILWVILFLKFKKVIFALFAGFAFGVTYLARNDVLLPLQIFFVSILFLALSKNISLKKLVLVYLLIGIGFVTTISPYLVFNYQKFGYLNLSAKLNASLSMPAYFAPQNNLTTTYAQEVWSIDTPNYDSKYFNEKFDFWKYRTNMIEGTRDRLIAYSRILNNALTKIEFAILFIGFFTSLFYFFKIFKPGLFLHALFILNFFLSVPFHPGVDIRYLFWMVPVIAIFWVMAIYVPTFFWIRITSRLPMSKKYTKAIKLIPLVIVNLLFLIYFFSQYGDNLARPPQISSQETDQYYIVGSYIKRIDQEKPRIMTRREAITYFADGETIYIPTSIGTEELRDYAMLWKVDYIVSDRFTLIPDSPLGYLVDESKAPGWLVPIKIWEGNITKTILYRVEL